MKININDGDENKNISEENQKFYREWFDSGFGQPVIYDWCRQLLNTCDGNTFEKFILTGEDFEETAGKAILLTRRYLIVSNIKAVSVSFSCKKDWNLSEYNKKRKELQNWCKENTTIYFNIEENPNQKEDFTVKLVFNYKLKKLNKDTKIDDMNFSVRASNKLKNLHAETLEELTALTSLEDPEVWCNAHKAADEILWALEKLGLKLGMKPSDWS